MTIRDLDEIWLTKKIYDDAENVYYENLNKVSKNGERFATDIYAGAGSLNYL